MRVHAPAEHKATSSSSGSRPSMSSARRPLSTNFPGGRSVVQAKLTVSAVDDPLEQEADRFADAVMRTPGPRLRQEHGIDLRGTFKEPNCGESYWRDKASPRTVNWSSYRSVCESWRKTFNKANGTNYTIIDTIP